MGSNRLSILDNHQAITDISIVPFYKNLDKSYPGSKFIMTTRETNSWLRSIKEHLTTLEEIDSILHPQFKRFRKRILNEVYGSSFYDEKLFIAAYIKHERDVLTYFKNRQIDVLLLDIISGEGWQKICHFLGKQIPNKKFPHKHSSKYSLNLGAKFYSKLVILRGKIEEFVQNDQKFIIIDGGIINYIKLTNRDYINFLEEDGSYCGPPPDEDSAIFELKKLKGSGFKFLVIPWFSFWWFDYYKEFNKYLITNFRCVLNDKLAVIFDLRK